ncbi:ABC transporter permease [Streptomyces formicae]|uniref:ABC transporter permease n=1 Tax=Streptomyces formicae TaxID=1616117 RepID=A0ABY3WTW2_9ACTN|nr:ABC transporter permease [Streptomyces formicae]UNM13223.1 ABC transporter permease [Streptomyces formicae]
MAGHLKAVRRTGGQLLLGAVTIAAVITLTFALLYLVPGDAARSIAGPRATPELLEHIREGLQLHAPVWEQYWHYAKGVATGDLGDSYQRGMPVGTLIADRLPATLLLAAAALVVEIAVGGALGAWEALRGRRLRSVLTANIALLSTPAFALGHLLLLGFGYGLGWFPVSNGADAAHLVLPALALGLTGMPYYSSAVRDALAATLASPHIRTAMAKGLPRRTVLRRHALRCALPPVISMAGMDIAIFASNVVFVENIFGWPGIGRLQATAFADQDRPLLMGTVIVAAVLVVIGNLLADTLRQLLDPRSRQDLPA